MDMNDNDMDGVFRRKLKDFSSEVPEGMWERVRPGRDGDSKPVYLWFFAAFIFLIVAVAIGYYFNNSEAVNHVYAGNLTDNKSGKGSPIISSGNISQANRTGIDNNLSEASIVNIPLKQKLKRTNESISHTRNAMDPSFKGEISGMGKKARNTTLVSSIERQHKQQFNAKGNSIEGADHDRPDRARVFQKNSEAAVVNPRKVITVGDPTETVDTAILMHRLNIGPHKSDSIDSILEKPKVPPAYLKTEDNKRLSKKERAEMAVGIRTPKNEEDGRVTDKPWFAQLEISNGRATQVYYTGDIGYLNHVLAGIRAGRFFTEHIYAQMGLRYSRTYLSFPDSLVGYDPGYVNSFDLPIFFGYRFSDGLFQPSINAGIVLNLYTWPNKGAVANSHTDIRKNTGVAAYLGIGLTRPLNSRFCIFAEPFYQYRLLTSINNNPFYPMRMNVFGVTAGMKYFFRKREQR